MNVSRHLLLEIEEMIRSRLDCYKILRGKFVPRTERFRLSEVLEESIMSERAMSATTNSKVTFSYDAGAEGDVVDHEVETDIYTFKHVLSNLLSNARKHTYKGCVVVRFLGADTQGGPSTHLLKFSVQDTGTGVHEDLVPKLFRSEVSPRGFCQLASTQRQDENGDGGSSDFQFGIAGKVISVLSVGDVAREQHEEASSKRMLVDEVHVVIIDDQSIIRKMMQRSIETTARGTSGWTYEGFPTAESAQPRIRELRDDSRALVVTDQNMASVGGVLTGTDLIRWMVALPFRGTIVSASGDGDIKVQHLEIGARFAWPKPIRRSKIDADLRYLFARKD
ncbi:hypothetical protein M885DRAFT_624934 [Pelagophyceae sp. CCMP2097]|nr:hypothetical protein M885DRAFT_624934 [Pelagophyceae sp. CCMP2097]